MHRDRLIGAHRRTAATHADVTLRMHDEGVAVPPGPSAGSLSIPTARSISAGKKTTRRLIKRAEGAAIARVSHVDYTRLFGGADTCPERAQREARDGRTMGTDGHAC
jgi:hypothetical protein